MTGRTPITSHANPFRTERSVAGQDWWRSRTLKAILAALDRDGEEARVVGGAIRNALFGLPPGDIDIATTATPDVVTERIVAAGFKVAKTGIEHGTVTAVANGRPFEITTLRTDVETFGRKATVRFGRDWRADAERRDFTMNALSADRDGQVHDYTGGLADLDARVVRFIGEPAQRIAEDYLRILRFFRFHAAYGEGEPDRAGIAACIAARHGLSQLSRERVRMELLKLLVARRAAAVVRVMTDGGIMQDVLGGVAYIAHLDAMVAIEHALMREADAMRRLAALSVWIVEDAERLSLRLRLSGAETKTLVVMADGWWRITRAQSETDARALLYATGPDGYCNRTLLAWARAGDAADDAAWSHLVRLPERWTAPVFPLKGADLIARGVVKGRALGKALRHAEAAWIASDFSDDRDVIARMADDAAHLHTRR